MAIMTLQKPTTAPTDRSMPPVMMTKVWPTARIAVIDPAAAGSMLLPIAEAGVWQKDSTIPHESTSSASRVSPKSDICRFTYPLYVFSDHRDRVSVLIVYPVAVRLDFFQEKRRWPASELVSCDAASLVWRIVAGNQLPAAEDMRPVGQLVDLRQVGGDQDDARTVLQELCEEA